MNSSTKRNAKEPKQYALPADVMATWWVAKGSATLRDRYVSLRFFGYKGAQKAAADHEMLINKFWKQVRSLYPALKDKTISLNESGYYVTVNE